MPKKFVVHTTKVIFEKKMGPAELKGSSTSIIKAGSKKVIIQGKAVCLQGDETKIKLTSTYVSGPFQAEKGKGEFKVLPFPPGPHLSPKHKVTGKAKIVQEGSKKFDVLFMVTKPAMMQLPNGSKMPDPVPIYPGKAHFDVKYNTKETEA